MRSLKQFAPVEGHTTLIRDMSSNAIISTDDAAYNAYKLRRESEKRRQELIDKQKNEIDQIKTEMIEIKTMLSQLIADRG